jgi:hypothetical protein
VQLNQPGIFDDDTTLSSQDIFFDRLPELIFLIALLIPHRLTLTNKTYYPKLFILSIGGLYFTYLMISPRPVLIEELLIMILYIPFGPVSPLTLYLKKHINDVAKPTVNATNPL